MSGDLYKPCRLAATPTGMYVTTCLYVYIACNTPTHVSDTQGRRHARAVGNPTHVSNPHSGAPPATENTTTGANPTTLTQIPPGGRCFVGVHGTYASYCTQVISTDLNTSVCGLLEKLVAWQHRAKERDPLNARARRRYVSGMRCVALMMQVPPYMIPKVHAHATMAHREVHKSVKLRKAKCLLVAPNVEEADGPHAPSAGIAAVLELAAQHDIPVVFTLTRKKLAQASGAKGGVSVVAVLDASGAEQVFREVLALAQQVL